MATKRTNSKSSKKQDKKNDDLVTFITPPCPTGYNHLNKPDDYEGKKTFKTSLILTDDLLDEIREVIDDAVEESYQAAIAETKSKKKQQEIVRAYPYEEEEDDDGEPTGKHVMRFKSNPAQKKTDFGNRRRFPIVDSAGNLTDQIVFGGSTVRIDCYVKPYFMKSTMKAGVTLYINGVQIIELAGGGGKSSDGSQFGSYDGGFVADDDDDEDADDSNDGADDDDEDDDDDF